jgi:hypothetical protein
MRVFISWSAARSRRFAEALREWLPNVVQSVVPIVSSEDIGKGVPWYSEIGTSIGESDVGLVVVTPENRENPWLNFEAGALSMVLADRRTCPVLIDMKSAQLIGPLANLNATEANSQHDMWRLLQVMKTDDLPTTVLRHAFDREWEELAKRIADIEAEGQPSGKPLPAEDDMLAEILRAVRGLTAVRPPAGASSVKDPAARAREWARRRTATEDSLEVLARSHGIFPDSIQLSGSSEHGDFTSVTIRFSGTRGRVESSDIADLEGELRSLGFKTVVIEEDEPF